MPKASTLPYYPRFIFTCDDGKCFSTADLDYLRDIKDADDKYEHDITQFVPGQLLKITWAADNNQTEVKYYEVDRLEVHQIKYDTNEPTVGMNSNDCTVIAGQPKKHLMEIYVFLKAQSKH
jgi:hypothetical protein